MKTILMLVILLILAAGISILFYSTPNKTSKENKIEKTIDLSQKDINGPRDSAASFFSYIYAGEYRAAAYRFLPKGALNKLEQSGKLEKFKNVVSANIPNYDLGKIQVDYTDENNATISLQLIEDPATIQYNMIKEDGEWKIDLSNILQ